MLRWILQGTQQRAGVIFLTGVVDPDLWQALVGRHFAGQTDQILALHAGRNAFGRQVDSFEADIDIPVLGERPVHAVFIRAPWVDEAGADVEVLGRVPAGPAAGKIVAVRQGHLLATSFHPELTGDTRVHQYFVEMVREQA